MRASLTFSATLILTAVCTSCVCVCMQATKCVNSFAYVHLALKRNMHLVRVSLELIFVDFLLQNCSQINPVN